MIEKEIAELRRILKAERTSATRVYGCYINGEGAIITEFERSFGLISEEETEQYLSLFRRGLSGTLHKNLMDISFSTAQVEYEVRERFAGQSKWSTRALVRYALTNITSFTAFPLHLVTIFGVITLLVSVVLGVIALVQKIMGTALGGFTTVIILLLFLGSLIMISLGIIGYYVGNIYEEIQDRPRYIIAEHCGDELDEGK